MTSYRDRTGHDKEAGDAIAAKAFQGGVLLELGTMRPFNSMAADAWAFLSPAEARELADDLRRFAKEAEA